MGRLRRVIATLALCYLFTLPHNEILAQTTSNYDRNRIDDNSNFNNNNNQFGGRGRFNPQQTNFNSNLNKDRNFNNNDTQRNLNPIKNPNDPGSFYDNSNRYTQNRNRGYNNYNNYGGYGFLDDGIDPNLMCPEHWISYRTSCLRFVQSPRRTFYEAKKKFASHQGLI